MTLRAGVSPSGNVGRLPVGDGQGITTAVGGEAEFVCAGGTALGGGEPLADGESIPAGVLRWDSAESGITCRDTDSGRGFILSRECYEMF